MPGRNHALLVASFAGIVIASSLFRLGLPGYDDAMYAHEARGMILHGDWWSVHYSGEPDCQHPPVFMWLEAISMSCLGASDFAARLPSALFGLATIIALYFLATELTGSAWFGICSMLVLATTQPFLRHASQAMTDLPFVFFFTLSLIFYLKGLVRPRYLLFAGLPVALAILTRSVFGLEPIAIIALHLVVTRRWRLLWSPQVIGGFLTAIALPAIWIVSQYHLHGAGFLRCHLSFIFGDVSSTGTWTPGLHVQNYAIYLLKYYWPWLPVCIAGLVVDFRTDFRAQRTRWLAPLWLAIVILPLTQAEHTEGRYLMPAFPAMAMVCAAALERWIAPTRRDQLIYIACAIMSGVAVYNILFTPPVRGVEIMTLAPLIDEYCPPGAHLLLYSKGFYSENQLLWYTHRYVDLATDPVQFKQKATPGTVGVMEKASFDALLAASPSVEILGQSGGFVCYRLN